MPLQLRWIASHSASCFHAVALIHDGVPFADSEWHAMLVEPTAALLEQLIATNLSPDRFLEHLVPQSAGIDNNLQLARIACQKAQGPMPEQVITRLAGQIEAVEAAARRGAPKLLEELALRMGPLREQWDARGPGLIKRIADLTDPQLIAESADVVLVRPAAGGAGTAHLQYNSVRIEAVLVNPVAGIPEIVRLAWLLGQLQCDLPRFGESIPRSRLARIASLALAPAALAAGELVECCRADANSLAEALRAWRIPQAPDSRLLWDWWNSYQIDRPPWNIAIEALDKMVETRN